MPHSAAPDWTLMPGKNTQGRKAQLDRAEVPGYFWGPGEVAQEAAAQIAGQDAFLCPGAHLSHVSGKGTWQWP